MAVVRARTAPPYALIAFVILWVISTGVAVWLFTQQAELKKRAEEATSKLPLYVSNIPQANEIRTLGAKEGARGNQPSAIDVVIKQRDEVAKVVTGTGPASPTSVDGATAAGGAAIRDAQQTIANVKNITPEGAKLGTIASLVDAVGQLRTYLTAADARVGLLQAQVEQGANDLAAARDAAKKASDAQAKAIEERSAEVNRLEAVVRDLNAKLPDAEKVLQDKLQKAQEEAEATIRKLKIDIADRDNRNAQLRKTVDDLTEKIRAGHDQVNTGIATNPSGKIIRTALTNGEVTIGIGNDARVKRGLTFAVFDGRTGVRIAGPTDPLKAGARADDVDYRKGTIEVIEVGEHESVCRVTWTARNQRIDNGDVVYNLVFSQQKDRKYHFAVFGEFDIDRDGISTSAERERVKQMIKDWGGIVDEIPVQELRDANWQPIMEKDKEGKPTDKVAKGPVISPQTDFLIVGTPPASLPTELANTDTVGAEQLAELRSKAAEFKFVENQAKQAGATVLNTNRFLQLIGYNNTTLVRN